MLPFTEEQFLSVFATYNAAIWPAQIAAYGVGAAAVILVFVRSPSADRAIAFALAVMWLWTGIACHVIFFSSINRPAILFGTLFAIQGLYLFHAGALRARITFPRATMPPGGSATLSSPMR